MARPESQPVDETRRLGVTTRWMERAVGSNRILLTLAGATITLSFLAGVLVRLVDEEDYPTVGAGVWWALVTFTTVGYGDVVPTTAIGRTVAGVVMVFGITFISLITAIVTSALISRRQHDEARPEVVHGALARIESRLDSIERRLPSESL